MDAETRWRRVRTLFEAVVELPSARRAARLSELAGDDAELRGEVERLLAAEPPDDGFLASPFAAADEPGLIGLSLGGFRVVRAIASGGMGRVWEAEQEEPRRRVAIKTLRADLASPQGRRRFRFEAELLAGLRHPAIAQLYGAGVLRTEGGALPWFALEFIEGAQPLVQHAEREGLDLAARLRLFLDVCGAIQHAHQRGVVHRDLKSGNLLVDRDGHVKVIDFGIARLIEREAAGAETRHTFAGEILGTLEAMSPEQIEGRGDEVDTRTDVWALGVVLYELVTGELPFDLRGLSLPEAARRICATDPPSPTTLARDAPREVDWIVATAMAKEPERRYDSVGDLTRDVERLLAREPVLAGPPSHVYRLRKFCERHSIGVATVSVAVIALAIGLSGTVYGVLEGDRAQHADELAALEADMTDRLAEFLSRTFDEARPTRADGRVATPVEILEQGTRWIREQAGGRPLVQAELLRKAGDVFRERAAFDEARLALEQAVELARGEGPEGESELAQSLSQLGTLHRALMEDDAAESCLREALTIHTRLHGPDHADLALIHNELGLLLRLSDPTSSEHHLRRAWEMLVREHGEDHGDAAILLANLGAHHIRARRYEEAREILERALPVLLRHHGERDPRVGGLLSNLAVVHLNLGDYEKAHALQQRELAIIRAVLPDDHPKLGSSLHQSARILERLGDLQGALEASELALETVARKHAAGHPEILSIRQDRSRLLLHLGRPQEAREEAERALDSEPVGFEGRLARLGALVSLARVERIAGDPDASLILTDEVLDDPASAPDGVLRARARWERAFAFLAFDDRTAADEERRRALALLPPGARGDPYADAIFATLAGEPESALPMLQREALAGYRNRLLLVAPELAPLRALEGFVPVREALARATAD